MAETVKNQCMRESVDWLLRRCATRESALRDFNLYETKPLIETNLHNITAN